ncbi:MAG: AAA family ATPase, partial [Acidimicrobiales bacterium]
AALKSGIRGRLVLPPPIQPDLGRTIQDALSEADLLPIRTAEETLQAIFLAGGESRSVSAAYAAHLLDRGTVPLDHPGMQHKDFPTTVDVPPRPAALRVRFQYWTRHLEAAPQVASAARDALALALASHESGHATSPTLLVGPPGCGKSHLISVISQHATRPCLRIDASQLTENGFKGLNLSESFQQAGAASSLRVSDLERSIVLLDEFDKLAAPGDSDAVFLAKRAGAQYGLLALLGGTGTISIANGQALAIEHMLVICAGAFASLGGADIDSEALARYGFLPELADRLQRVIRLERPSRAVHLAILRGRFGERDEASVTHERSGLRVVLAESTLGALAMRAERLGWPTRRLLKEADGLVERALLAALRSGADEVLVSPDDIGWRTGV